MPCEHSVSAGPSSSGQGLWQMRIKSCCCLLECQPCCGYGQRALRLEMLAGAQEPDIGRGGGTGGASVAGRVTTVICALEEGRSCASVAAVKIPDTRSLRENGVSQ